MDTVQLSHEGNIFSDAFTAQPHASSLQSPQFPMQRLSNMVKIQTPQEDATSGDNPNVSNPQAAFVHSDDTSAAYFPSRRKIIWISHFSL